MKDIIDIWISNINWKIGKFSILPIVFGLTMSMLDVGMMSIAKMSSEGQIPFRVALPLATLVYSITPFIFMKSLKYESLTSMNLIWDLTSDIMVTILGVFYFKESIKGLRWLAVMFALFSLGLFAYTEE